MKRLLIGALFLLGACASSLNPVNTTNKTFNTTQAGQDVALITADLPAIANVIENLTTVSPATKAKVAADLVLAQNAAKEVSASTSTAGAQPYVLAFETSVNAILAVASGITTIPEPYLSIIQATSVLLPIVEAAINPSITGVELTTSNTLSPTQARLILKGATISTVEGLNPTQARLILQGGVE
jgi:hypothetical protein